MADPHQIRLRGPWGLCMRSLQQSAEAQSEPTVPRRIRVPYAFDATHDLHARQLHFERTFNCPTGLTGTDRVYIVVERYQGNIAVALNGASLPCLEAGSGDDNACRVEVTGRLGRSNRLWIDLTSRDAAPFHDRAAVLGEVWLEIVSG